MAIVSDVLGGGSKGPACPTLGRRRLRAVTGVLRRVPPSRGRALALVLTRLSPLRPHPVPLSDLTPCPPLRHAERGNERAVRSSPSPPRGEGDRGHRPARATKWRSSRRAASRNLRVSA